MSEITKKEIEELKKKYGQIYQVEFEDGKIIYLKKPDRKVLKFAMTLAQTDPLGMAESLLKNCQVAGDEITADDSYLLGVAPQLDRIIEVKNAELKKL